MAMVACGLISILLFFLIIGHIVLGVRARSLRLSIHERTVREKALLEEHQLLKDRDSVKHRLFAVLAHDLRGPVGNIATLLGIFAEEVESGKELSGPRTLVALQEMQKSAKDTYVLLENLLGWIRSSVDGATTGRVNADITTIVAQVMTVYHKPAKDKGITITQLHEGPLHFMTDPPMVEAVLRNFISNAIKFSPAGGAVTIAYHASSPGGPKSLKISVCDQGSGVSPGARAGLFTQVLNGSAVGTRGEKGSGVGLLFCNELANRSGAFLDYAPLPEGGSEFSLVLTGTDSV